MSPLPIHRRVIGVRNLDRRWSDTESSKMDTGRSIQTYRTILRTVRIAKRPQLAASSCTTVRRARNGAVPWQDATVHGRVEIQPSNSAERRKLGTRTRRTHDTEQGRWIRPPRSAPERLKSSDCVHGPVRTKVATEESARHP